MIATGDDSIHSTGRNIFQLLHNKTFINILMLYIFFMVYISIYNDINI